MTKKDTPKKPLWRAIDEYVEVYENLAYNRGWSIGFTTAAAIGIFANILFSLYVIYNFGYR